MKTEKLTERFSQWIIETEEHPEMRLETLEKADELLNNPELMVQSDERRSHVADTLESWRYHLLKNQNANDPIRKKEFLEMLDLTANLISVRKNRTPRKATEVVHSRLILEDNYFTEEQIRNLITNSSKTKELSKRAQAITRSNFSNPEKSGKLKKRMSLYAPLYLSNYCINSCLYCGFRYSNELNRIHLEMPEVIQQAEILKENGFKNILLVAGDFPKLTSTNYFVEIIKELKNMDLNLSVEIAPMKIQSYEMLFSAGAKGITLYQETYNKEYYRIYHPKGTKSYYEWRLEGLERAAETGFQSLGLGILLGLTDPVEELISLIRHGLYIQSRFPDSLLSFSLPRIYEGPDDFKPAFYVDDNTFIRMYCVLRSIFPKSHLVLSTRESIPLRNKLADICITKMSAGSSTAPGGYESNRRNQKDRQQFPTTDNRSPLEVKEWLEKNDFEINWIE